MYKVTERKGNNKGDRWFITKGCLLLKHLKSQILWFWRFKVRE
jgi:hypothetical protein